MIASDSFILIAVDRIHHRCWLSRDAMGFQNAYWARREQGLWVGAYSITTQHCLESQIGNGASLRISYPFDIHTPQERCTKIDTR